jgi:hypothetical protein
MKVERPRLQHRPAAAAAVALIAAVALAACGGSSGGSKPPASANTGATSGSTGAIAGRSALEACLKQHGVTLPSFAGRGGFAGRPGVGASGRFGTSGRFGATGVSGRLRRFGFGASGRFGASGASGPRGFFAGNSKFAAAFRACAADDPGGFPARGGFARPGANGAGGFNVKSAADRAEVERYVACVRQHGFDIPAPNFSGQGSVFSTAKVDTHSAKFITASNACQSLLTFGNAS